jgi:hypothetical protein
MTARHAFRNIVARAARPAFAVSVLLLSACASTTADGTALSAGTQASIEGSVHAVDTAPWAYDGHATVSVDTAAHGRVQVQLPARWNLCKAPAPADPNTLQAGTRVRATGTVSAEGTLVVCEQAGHRLERVP